VRNRAASVAAAASLLAIAIGCAAVLSQEQRHQLGSNYVRPVGTGIDLRSGVQLCQSGLRLPGGTGGVGLRADTFGRPGPELRLTIRGPGTPAVRGALAAGWRRGYVVVPIPELAAEQRDARVCVEHRGPDAIAIAAGLGIGDDATRDGKGAGDPIRLEYVEPERRTWFSVLPEIADRLGVARDALPAGASLALFALLAIGVLVGTLALVVREGSR
jgi:hypothetical protein